MYEIIIFAIAGAFGGFVRTIITGKGIIMLPGKDVKKGHTFINLGFLAPVVIGIGAGIIAPYSLGVDAVISFLAGYSGSDIIENAVERYLKLP